MRSSVLVLLRSAPPVNNSMFNLALLCCKAHEITKLLLMASLSFRIVQPSSSSTLDRWMKMLIRLFRRRHGLNTSWLQAAQHGSGFMPSKLTTMDMTTSLSSSTAFRYLKAYPCCTELTLDIQLSPSLRSTSPGSMDRAGCKPPTDGLVTFCPG
ncbi:hypothetical protein PM082_023328 [Marasmius tenuissimus]|nr:hypothetical protein PM082_023317 [Marasmius tenuissimus]KAJ8094120.1 hypothetical protein PM082_023328 [Marasmius tenuissimus]